MSRSLISRSSFIIIALLLALSTVSLAQGIAGRVIAWRLNVRSHPTINATNVIGQLAAQTPVIIEGRTEANDWLYIRTEDSSLAGWAATRYIAFDASQLSAIPVSAQVATAPAGSAAAPAGSAATSATTTTTASLSLIMNTSTFHNMTTSTVYNVFARGQNLGNNPRIFMKVGDSVTATQPFLQGFGSGHYDLGPYGYLQPTIEFFSVSPIANVPNSFLQTSVAAAPGFVSGAVFDGTWSPEYCANLVPLHCEYDIIRPSVAIVMFGGQDVRLFDAVFFETNMRRIAVDLKALGVIPVFTTFPLHASFRQEEAILFNTIVINIANEQGIPLINLYRALQNLPEGGAKPDDPVHLTQGDVHFNFNGDEGLYGVTLRNLLTLQALDSLRIQVLQR